MPMVEPRAPCRRGTSDHEAATAAMSTIDASAPAWSRPRSSTCSGRARHVQTHAARALVERSDLELLDVPAKQAVRSGEVSAVRGARARRARLADAASVRHSRRPGRSAGPGRSRGLPVRKGPRRGRPGRDLAAGPAPPPPRPPRLPRRGTARTDRHSPGVASRRDPLRSRRPVSRPWSGARRSHRHSGRRPRSCARDDTAARRRRDRVPPR